MDDAMNAETIAKKMARLLESGKLRCGNKRHGVPKIVGKCFDICRLEKNKKRGAVQCLKVHLSASNERLVIIDAHGLTFRVELKKLQNIDDLLPYLQSGLKQMAERERAHLHG